MVTNDESSQPEYFNVARAAGLTPDQLELIEQLFGVNITSDPFFSHMLIHSTIEAVQGARITIQTIRELLAKQGAIEQEIRSAFADTTREGGTSWSEGWAIDNNGTEEECAAARALDMERSWAELVDDPHWHLCNGPWSFLDEIGFRYYLAPAMIRCVRETSMRELEDALRHPIYEPELRALLTPPQSVAIQYFLEYFLTVEEMFGYSEDNKSETRTLLEKWRYR